VKLKTLFSAGVAGWGLAADGEHWLVRRNPGGTGGSIQLDPQRAELVKLRYFVGMTIPEAAEAMGISEPTAKRYWAFARAWLHEEIRGQCFLRHPYYRGYEGGCLIFQELLTSAAGLLRIVRKVSGRQSM
jgi:hypothetical protein